MMEQADLPTTYDELSEMVRDGGNMDVDYDGMVERIKDELYEIIDETYLGPDVIITELQQKQHFEWCWKKNIHTFDKESIYFKESGQHYVYMWNFFNEAYYMNDNTQNRIKEYFRRLFQFDYKKTRSELDMLTEIYKILESNIKK